MRAPHREALRVRHWPGFARLKASELWRGGPWVLGLLAMTTLAFLPVLRNDFVNYDDPFTLQHNDQLVAPGTWRWAFTTTLIGHYQPLSWIVWSVVAAVSGREPGAFHALSLAVHLVNVALIYLLTVHLLRRSGVEPVECRTAALVAAALFAVHPMRVEPVAWA